MINAVNYAMGNGYEAVTCGHTHYPEDIVFNGIRYINTGAWTEFPVFYLQVTGDELYLKTIDKSSYKYTFQSPSISNKESETLPFTLKN